MGTFLCKIHEINYAQKIKPWGDVKILVALGGTFHKEEVRVGGLVPDHRSFYAPIRWFWIYYFSIAGVSKQQKVAVEPHLPGAGCFGFDFVVFTTQTFFTSPLRFSIFAYLHSCLILDVRSWVVLSAAEVFWHDGDHQNQEGWLSYQVNGCVKMPPLCIYLIKNLYIFYIHMILNAHK